MNEPEQNSSQDDPLDPDKSMNDQPIESVFDDALCKLIERFSGEGMMSAGQIIAVMTFVQHRLIHKADDIADEENKENFKNDVNQK